MEISEITAFGPASALAVSRAARAAVVAGALFMLACQPGANKDADKPADPAAETSTTATAPGEPGAAAASSGPCEDYAKKVCEAAGAESTTCASMREATSLMPAAACKVALADPEALTKSLANARKACDQLVSQLCKDLGEQTPTCAMVKATTPEFPTERCTMMLGRYDEVLADLRKQEARSKPLEGELLAAIHEDNAPSFGPKDAKVTIVEFSDFQCPYCSRAATAAGAIKAKYADRVRFVFRQFPLSFHQQAHLAAQAALAADAQGKFWEYHDKLFADQAQLERPALEASAKALGLDLGAFKKALDGGTHKERVDADLALGEKVGVDGTPTMFLNGKRVDNPTDVAAISAAIDQALGGGAPAPG